MTEVIGFYTEFGGYLNIPALSAKAPMIPAYLLPYTSGFFTLSPDRKINSNSIGHIPFRSIVAYMDWIGIDDQERFLEIIRSVDDEYVRKQNKKAEQQSKAGVKL
tara:strand:+ start:665 stop:979 length:315 start_codon:yes stop_codon:yes gene_type:complete